MSTAPTAPAIWVDGRARRVDVLRVNFGRFRGVTNCRRPLGVSAQPQWVEMVDCVEAIERIQIEAVDEVERVLAEELVGLGRVPTVAEVEEP